MDNYTKQAIKADVSIIIKSVKKLDFNNPKRVLGVKKLIEENNMVKTQYGRRFCDKLDNLAVGNTDDNLCVICSKPAENLVICKHCMDLLAPHVEAKVDNVKSVNIPSEDATANQNNTSQENKPDSKKSGIRAAKRKAPENHEAQKISKLRFLPVAIIAVVLVAAIASSALYMHNNKQEQVVKDSASEQEVASGDEQGFEEYVSDLLADYKAEYNIVYDYDMKIINIDLTYTKNMSKVSVEGVETYITYLSNTPDDKIYKRLSKNRAIVDDLINHTSQYGFASDVRVGVNAYECDSKSDSTSLIWMLYSNDKEFFYTPLGPRYECSKTGTKEYIEAAEKIYKSIKENTM